MRVTGDRQTKCATSIESVLFKDGERAMTGGNCLKSAALPPYPELVQDFQTVPKEEEEQGKKPSLSSQRQYSFVVGKK